MTPDQRQILEAFSAHLPRGGRVLYSASRSADSPEERRTPEWLRAHGFEVEEVDPSKDLRLLSLPRETFDGIWAGRALVSFPIEQTQRVVATFFQALRPRAGVLFTAYLEGSEPAEPSADGSVAYRYPELAFASMLRQSGFQLLAQAQREISGKWIGVIARRA